MAQDTFLNIVVDAGVANTDPARHRHSLTRGAAAAGDLTVSFDHLKITNLQAVDSVYLAIRNGLIAAGFK